MKKRKIIFLILILGWFVTGFAQQSDDVEFSLDINTNVSATPNAFKPNIDLSGRGFNRDNAWPQGLASAESLDTFGKEIGYPGLYRIQYNLWDIKEASQDKELPAKLMANYETMIKKVMDSGGVVILDLFGTPKGLGKVLDKRSAPADLKKIKALVKDTIRYFSCEKRYSIWYEVWSAPDLDSFFLGRTQDYLNLYRAIAEAVQELEEEKKIDIFLGGPAISWWYQSPDNNSILAPEKSLIYELIRFCARYKLPLDFISWHAYSTDPQAEKELTIYKKTTVSLIRDWLTYFQLDKNTPLIIDEWNYDDGANFSKERAEDAYVTASYVLSRIKNMADSGVDAQLYYCLEDFSYAKEGVVRNTGLFWFDPEDPHYKGGAKASYNVFKMLARLGPDMYSLKEKNSDEFVNALATRFKDEINIVLFNYIDPEIGLNFIARNIATLNGAERKSLLDLIKSNKFKTTISNESDLNKLRFTNRVKTLLRKARELEEKAAKFKAAPRNVKINLTNLKDNYLYTRYVIDSSCGNPCAFSPAEEKELNAPDSYQETLTLKPYSACEIILKKKPQEAVSVKPPETVSPTPAQTPDGQNK